MSGPASPAAGAPSVADLVARRAEDDHPGLRFEDLQWTWREVVTASAVRASWIRSLGGEERVHIGVLLGNVPEYLFWLGAAALAGAVVVGINPTRRGEALGGDIRRTDCRVVLTDAEGAGMLEGLDLGVPTGGVLRVDDPAFADRLAPHAGCRPSSVLAARRPGTGGSVPPAVHFGDHRAAQGGPVLPGTPRLHRQVRGRGLRVRAATTWPTAPCPSSTGTP